MDFERHATFSFSHQTRWCQTIGAKAMKTETMKTMKKLMIMCAVLSIAFCMRADTETVNGIIWNYIVSDGKANIKHGKSSVENSDFTAAIPIDTTGAIMIPSTLGGYPVTSIGECALFNCTGLTSVTIPSSVTNIGEYAFCFCSGLTNVTIPSSVTSIGEHAFYQCPALTSVTIPNGVTSIGDSAFSYCSALTSVTISSSVTSIGKHVFYSCRGLTRVTIPDGVTSIGEGAFYSCSSLASVTIPSSVTSIGDRAFCDCSSLVEVIYLGNSDDIDFGSHVFEGTPYYASIPFEFRIDSNGVLTGFLGPCPESMVIPDSVTSIGEYAFLNCFDLKSVTIPDSVTSIGGSAFRSCSSLTSVTIPNSVTSIGGWAFYYCSSLVEVIFNGDAPTTIGYNAFGRTADECTAYVTHNSTGWEVEIPGTWNEIKIAYQTAVSEPIPEVMKDSEVATALSGSADAKLAANITTATEYAAYRAWALGLEGVTPQQVKDSAYSWLSYALDTDAPIAAAPKEGDLTIGGFTQGSSAGVFDLSVSISGITVGDNATAANLKKVFDVEGAGSLDESEFKEANVDIEFGKPEGGKVKIKAIPKDPTAKQFFMRVRMKQ